LPGKLHPAILTGDDEMKRKLMSLLLIAGAFLIFQHYERSYITANEYIRYMSALAWSDYHTPWMDPVFARLFP
jgi:hypothetical protein